MRRLGGVLLCVVLIACTGAPERGQPREIIANGAPSTGQPPISPTPELTVDPTATCEGLGRAPSRGQVTLVRNDRLIAVTPNGATERCLADVTEIYSGDSAEVSWNAPGNRALVSGRVLARDLTATAVLTRFAPTWSRPTGTSIVWVEDGRLMKRSSFGGKARDISFLARHDDVTYHPAGTHIATSGLAGDGSYGLYLATNLGTDEELLAIGEQARFLTSLEFSHEGRDLFYTARHGPANWHLHSLKMGPDAQLSTLHKSTSNMPFVVNPFSTPYSDVAWTIPGDCAAGEPDRLKSRTTVSAFQIPRTLRSISLRPIGWLARGLVVASSPVGCEENVTADVYVLGGKEPVRIASDVEAGSVAVRTILPPPPPPPGSDQPVVA